MGKEDDNTVIPSNIQGVSSDDEMRKGADFTNLFI